MPELVTHHVNNGSKPGAQALARSSCQNIKPAAFCPPPLHPYPHALPGTSVPHFTKSWVSGSRDQEGLLWGGVIILQRWEEPWPVIKLVPDLEVGGTQVSQLTLGTTCFLPNGSW